MQDVFLHFLKFFWGENVGFSMPISSVHLTLSLVFVFKVFQVPQFSNFREFFLFTTTQKKNAAVLYVETPTFKIAGCGHKIIAWEILLHGEICRYWLFFMFNAMRPTFFVKNIVLLWHNFKISQSQTFCDKFRPISVVICWLFHYKGQVQTTISAPSAFELYPIERTRIGNRNA